MTKVKDDPKITGRWVEYNTALLEEWDVLWSEGEDDYQGNCAFVAWTNSSWDPQFVMVDWGWGSCSGCDGYEDMEEGERVKAFMNQRSYFTETTMEVWLENFEDANRTSLEGAFLNHDVTPILGQVNAIRHALDKPAWTP